MGNWGGAEVRASIRMSDRAMTKCTLRWSFQGRFAATCPLHVHTLTFQTLPVSIKSSLMQSVPHCTTASNVCPQSLSETSHVCLALAIDQCSSCVASHHFALHGTQSCQPAAYGQPCQQLPVVFAFAFATFSFVSGLLFLRRIRIRDLAEHGTLCIIGRFLSSSCYTRCQHMCYWFALPHQ